MRLIEIPLSVPLKRNIRWFADRLQFHPEGQELLLEMILLRRHTAPQGGISHSQPREWDYWGYPYITTREFGQAHLATGQWKRFNLDDVSYADECLERTWSQDFSRVVTGTYLSLDETVIEIHVGDTKHLIEKSRSSIDRAVETSPQTASVSGLAFSPDGRWLYGAEHWRVERSTAIARADLRALFAKPVVEKTLLNRLTNQESKFQTVEPMPWNRFASLPGGVTVGVVSVSPDGKVLAVGSNEGDTHLIRVRGGESLGVLKRKRIKRTTNVAVRRIAFSPTGKQLGAVADGVLKVWDVKAAKLIWDTESEKVHAVDLAYHPNGKTLAVVRQDGAAAFVDYESGALKKRYDWKVGQLNSIAFSPDGLTCAAGGEKGQVVVWDVDN